MAIILMPLPNMDFDPTETAVPWLELTQRGHNVFFATPNGIMAKADPRMVHGSGLGPWKSLLRADKNGRAAYYAMIDDPRFKQPWDYKRAACEHIDGLILPGGHASGMLEYLQSGDVQAMVTTAFERNIPVGAICHGVIVAARSKTKNGKSVLFGRKTTALTRSLEISGWMLTVAWLGNYYRTYPETVQEEVTGVLANPNDFVVGPFAFFRDSREHLVRGFTVRDGNYLSARWPGDAHRFAVDYADMFE